MDDLGLMMLSCTFQGAACNASDFVFVDKFGASLQCFRFNSGFDDAGQPVPLRTVSAMSTDTAYNSLRMEIYAGLPLVTKLLPLRGYNVYIHYADDFSYNSDRFAMRVSPGLGKRIGVRRRFTRQYNAWPYAYSDCTFDVEHETLIRPLEADSSLFELANAFNSTYTRDTCYYLCAQDAVVRTCNCTSYVSEFAIDSYDYCMSTVQVACLWEESLCRPRCPLECSRQTFDYHTSSYKYPPSARYAAAIKASQATKQATKLAGQSDYVLNFAQNIVEFSVFYDSLWYNIVEEEPRMTMEGLIGEIGGHLHIFLGMSLLSFVEIAELVLFIGLWTCGAVRDRRRRGRSILEEKKPVGVVAKEEEEEGKEADAGHARNTRATVQDGQGDKEEAIVDQEQKKDTLLAMSK